MKPDIQKLEKLSTNIRIQILEMLLECGFGHVGGSLSIVEVLSVLYGYEMDIDPKNPLKEDRDMLVLSKGHAGPALYSTLAKLNYFDTKILSTLNQGGTSLPSHPDRLKTIGIDATTGSLGQGTSIAAGLATSFKLKKSKQRVFLIVGDGELNEGQCWEAFQYIAHHQLHQCVVIIDDNKKQLDGYTKDIINPFSIKDKMKAFGFYTLEVNGRSEKAIIAGLDKIRTINNQAVCLVLDTTKGQGVPYFEDMLNNHSVKFDNDEIIGQTKQAIEALNRKVAS